ncbi:MAG: hypothetical protein AAGC65_01770 [Mucilaginibacter sp.]|uniref:toxin-antitoxin system YwqK family antitoxin n=1 Tax=Mucilaginibacter sp. TaxID=1882438 RepID=UPI0031A4AB65
MRSALLLFLICSPLILMAQKMPDYGNTQVRINDTDKTIRAGIEAVPSNPKTYPDLNYYWLGGGIIHQLQGGYSGQLLHGSYQEYDLRKNLRMQGTFQRGLKDGIWKTWNESGKLVSIVTWDKGWLTGPFTLYTTEGKEKTSGYYDHNLLDGPLTTGLETDSLKTVRYKKGKIVPPKPHKLLQRINIFKKHKKPQAAPPPKP